MWRSIGKVFLETEVPIAHVTNGVHFRSWVSFDLNQLYDRCGPKSREETGRFEDLGTRRIHSCR